MSSINTNHPLPQAPGQQYQQRPGQQRQRAKSSFSFRSSNSHKSNGSLGKIDYNETHEEKEARRLHTKADPSMALSEAEPSAVASGVKSSLAPIRAMQHRDSQGNTISDPDRSNPTRNRWERPLDTIRAFEAAIDGNYQRQSYLRTEPSEGGSNPNRRGSYYGGTQVSVDDRPRYPQNSYYGGGRSHSYRPESQYIDGRQNGHGRDSYYNGADNHGHSNGYHPNRARYPRTASEPHFQHGQGVYPAPGNQHSYETVTTASGSGMSADPAGYATDPSSENSSVDRATPLPPMKEPADNYGFNGFGNTPQYQLPARGNQQHYGNGNGVNSSPGGAQGNGYPNHSQGPPPLPRKESTGPRVPMKLGKSTSNTSVERPAPAEKRKSWFGKRFSKS